MAMSRELINVRKDIRYLAKQLSKYLVEGPDYLTFTQFEYLYDEYKRSQNKHEDLTGQLYTKYLV